MSPISLYILSLPCPLFLCPILSFVPLHCHAPPCTHPIFPNLFFSLAYPQILRGTPSPQVSPRCGDHLGLQPPHVFPDAHILTSMLSSQLCPYRPLHIFSLISPPPWYSRSSLWEPQAPHLPWAGPIGLSCTVLTCPLPLCHGLPLRFFQVSPHSPPHTAPDSWALSLALGWHTWALVTLQAAVGTRAWPSPTLPSLEST